MKMKYTAYIGLMFIFVLLSSRLHAQENSNVEQYKIAFITEQLDLSPAEAEKFWPIYNKHIKLYQELKRETWEPIKDDLNNIDELSEQQADQLLKRYMGYRQKRLQYREDFVSDLLKVISSKKVMQLKKADYDFNKELLARLKTE